MAALNKVILIGHLTADPELKQTSNGVAVTNFTIGINRRVKGDQAVTDFISVVAWRGIAEFVCKFFKKGNAICVCGSIQTRSYDAQDGTKRYITEVVADEATFVERKSGEGNQAVAAPAPAQAPAEANFEEVAEDGDLPF